MRFLTVLFLSVFISSHALAASDPTAEDKVYIAAHNGHKDAIATLQSKAENGDVRAQYFLGRELTMSSSQCAAGIKWLEKAGDQGHATAQLSLAGAYRFGCAASAPVDYKQAYYWELLALKTSHDYPLLPGRLTSDMVPDDFGIPKAIELFEKNLTADEIAGIRKRVAEWKPFPAPDKAETK